MTNYITRLLTQTGREVELKLARVENEAVLVLSSIVQYSRGQRVHCTVSNQSKYLSKIQSNISIEKGKCFIAELCSHYDSQSDSE